MSDNTEAKVDEIPEDEFVDIEPFEGEPEFEEAPWKNTNEKGAQDDG